jgi:hypothetical protein
MIKYFGELPIGSIFLFQEVKLKKISDWQGETLKGKRRVEIAFNVRVFVEDKGDANLQN